MVLEEMKFENLNRVRNPNTDGFERGKLGEHQHQLFD
jgi:hypothetical protein